MQAFPALWRRWRGRQPSWPIFKLATTSFGLAAKVPAGPILRSFFPDMKPNFPAWAFGELKQLPDVFKKRLDVLPMPTDLSLQCRQSVCQFPMQRKRFAEANKDAHDCDVDLDGARAAEHAGEHGHALFGKSVGQIFEMLPTL
jgi:hypothetical protein